MEQTRKEFLADTSILQNLDPREGKMEEQTKKEISADISILQNLDPSEFIKFIEAAIANKPIVKIKSKTILDLLESRNLIIQSSDTRGKAMILMTQKAVNVGKIVADAMNRRSSHVPYFPIERRPPAKSKKIDILMNRLIQELRFQPDLTTKLLNAIEHGYFTNAHVAIKLTPELQKFCKILFGEKLNPDLPTVPINEIFKRKLKLKSLNVDGPVGLHLNTIKKPVLSYVFDIEDGRQVLIPIDNYDLMKLAYPNGRYKGKEGFQGIVYEDEESNLVGIASTIEIEQGTKFIPLFDMIEEIIPQT